MPIIVSEETCFPLGEAPKHLPPRGGKRIHQATIFRWAKSGVRGVRLETIRVGGSLCTSSQALQRFCERLSATDDGGTEPTGPRSLSAREKATQRAEAELAAVGI